MTSTPETTTTPPTTPVEPGAGEAAAGGPTLASHGAWRIAAVIAPVVVLAVHVYVMWGTAWPAFPFDEVTLLQIARQLAGQEVPDVVRGAGYYPGWAVLITPIFWFTTDPSAAYQASLWVGVVLSMLTIWPLTLIVRRFAVATAPAVVIASVVMALPARALQADYSLSERLVTLLLVTAVLAAFRLAERPTVVRHAAFAVVLGLLLFTHIRMSVVLIAAGVWLLLRLPRHLVASALGLGMLAASYVIANYGGNELNRALLGRPIKREDALLQRLSDSRPDLFLRTAVGQSWNQSLASFGIVALGLIVLVVLVFREVRRFDFGAATFIFGAATLIVFVSLAQWSNDYLLFIDPRNRLDGWIYGRYIDPIATVLVAIGLAALLKGVSRSVAVLAVGLNVAVAAMGALYLTREVPTWGYITPAHIPGVMPWQSLLPTTPWPRDVGIVPTLTNENRIWIIAPLCVLVILLAALALRRKPVLVASGLLVLAGVGTVLAAESSQKFHADEGLWVDMRDQLTAITTLSSDEPIGYAYACGNRVGLSDPGQNYFGYGVAPAPLDEVTSPEDVGDMEIVIACERWSDGEGLGARRLDGPSVYASFVWIMPGGLQDDLDAQGRLLPAF